MPIRINLLAETQALEDLRRRDPVKRAIWVGVLLVMIVLAWSSSLWVKGLIANGELNNLETTIKAHSEEYQRVQANQQKLTEAENKLTALHELAADRFLNGDLLNALQQATVPNVQLTHLKMDQKYVLTEAIKPKTEHGKTIPGKPATVTEKFTLTLEAKDSSPVPGDAVTKYKRAIATSPYFVAALGRTNEVRLKDLGTPQTGPDGKSFVLFSLECRFPERTR